MDNDLSYTQESVLLDRIVLEKAVSSLTRKQQVVIAMKQAGFNFGEMAEVLGMTRQAAGAVFRRAKEKIKPILEEGI